MKFSFVQSNEIDFVKWNKTIDNSQNPLIYAYSFFLESACENWAAIISDDYNFILPLPFVKFFNKYIFHNPFFIPKLGYFSNFVPENILLEQIFSELPQNSYFLNFDIIKTNNLINNKNINVSKKKIFSTDLFYKYTQFYENYSGYIKNLKKNNEDYYLTINQTSPNEIINFLNNISFFKKKTKHYETLRKLISITTIKNLNTIICAYSKQNEIVGTCVFLNSKYSTDLIFISALNDDPLIIFKMIDTYLTNFSNKAINLNFEWFFSKNLLFILKEMNISQSYRVKISYRTHPKVLLLLSKIIND